MAFKRGKIQFWWTFLTKSLLHKFNCFSLFKAPKINSFILWTLTSALFVTYFIMYVFLPPDLIDSQWRTFLIDNGLNLFGTSVIVFYTFKDSRNAGLATFWMIHCAIMFFAAIFGFHMQIFWFNAMIKLFMLGLAYYIIADIYKRSKSNGSKLL